MVKLDVTILYKKVKRVFIMRQSIPFIALLSAALAAFAQQDALQATVRADRPGHAIPKTLFGIFFEDINDAADGGLYPELICNRLSQKMQQPNVASTLADRPSPRSQSNQKK